VAEERAGVGGSSSTILYCEWSSCSRDGRRGRIHVGLWPEAAGSSSWLGTMSTDLHQPSLGSPGRRPYASNRVLVTVVTQGVVGLEKSRAVVGREWRRRVRRERRRQAGRVAATVGRGRTLWICLARSRIWTARVTVFNETTRVPLTALRYNWNSMGIIVNIGGKFWAARTWFICWCWRVGRCHRWRWLVNPHRLCWELGPAGEQRLFFLFWLLTLTRGPATIFFWMKRASLKY
jgi:hypothetical protein